MNIVEIGSSARGDGDYWSDRDVLVIAAAAELPGIEARLSAKGASVVSLTHGKFDWLASKGSLFLKHAIDEGVILDGASGCWESLTNRWCSNGDYSQEIQSNLNFLPMLRCIPTQADAAATAVDIMVCSVRNILIRELASRGIFSFSWRDICRSSCKVFKFSAGAWRAIYWAREQKNKRRARLPTYVEAIQVEEFAEIYRMILGSNLISWTSSSKRIERLASNFTAGSYAQLRAFELLCSSREADIGLSKLREITANPSYFCSGRSGLQ
ncbi:hypothetical protein [Xanthomonas arboricola]|uniref:hypothetical protein n=1 Tax=Xanthomonas arboricola TaxID=56448 RepID=UPI00129079D0|nr:hypothetical protein [Xanthomonas arboricola]